MVTTQRQILEKMAGRRLTNQEYQKLQAVSHNEALTWCKAVAMAEGRKPGYKR